jgi:LysR family hca operon transcriptional activator
MVILVTQNSPELTSALLRRKVDVTVLRPVQGLPDLAFKHLTSEPLVVVLPSDHRLAAFEVISPQDFEGETFVTVTSAASVLRAVIDDYLKKSRSAREAAPIYLPFSVAAKAEHIAGPVLTITLQPAVPHAPSATSAAR